MSLQHPAIGRQQVIQRRNNLRGSAGVWLNDRMDYLGKETQEHLVRTTREPESWVVEYPVVVPVVVGYTVLTDITVCRLETPICRGQRLQIIETSQEGDFTQSTPPGPALSPQVIEDVATRHLTDTSRPVPAIVERVIEELHHEVSIAAPTVNRRDRQLSPSWPRYPLSLRENRGLRHGPDDARIPWSGATDPGMEHPAPPRSGHRLPVHMDTARRLDAHARRHRRRRQQRTPARVADDAELGASAIAAIKYLSDDRG